MSVIGRTGVRPHRHETDTQTNESADGQQSATGPFRAFGLITLCHEKVMPPVAHIWKISIQSMT